MKKTHKILIQILLVIIAVLWVLSLDFSNEMGKPLYGVSFSKFHSDELGLDWKKTYLSILNDLKVKNLRLSAHWPMIEPAEGRFNFSELDFQMDQARQHGVSVILAVGRRLPGWPECHEPIWIRDFEEKHEELEEAESENELLLRYLKEVVNRYKDYPNLKYWQVENEPFLEFFGRAQCHLLNESNFKEEISLVKKLDPNHPILVTDSGEFGTWRKAYRYGDVFGSSMYLYIWSQQLGPLRYPITPAFFRIKHNLVRLFLGAKPSFVIELSAEPWLLQPIVETPIETQFDRMGLDKFNEIIEFSSKTGFNGFYFWGAEWWYWLDKQGYSEHWQRAKELFAPPGLL